MGSPLTLLFKIPIHYFLCLQHLSTRVLQFPMIFGNVYMSVWLTSYAKCFTSVKLYRTSFSQNKLTFSHLPCLCSNYFNDFCITSIFFSLNLPSPFDLLSGRIYHWSLIPQYLSNMLFSRCLNICSWLTDQNYVLFKKNHPQGRRQNK